MTTRQFLTQLVESGVHRIGEIEIQYRKADGCFIISHHLDACMVGNGDLELHQSPEAARDISTYSASGEYRFTKAQVNLRRGWVMIFSSIDELRLALDHFYPAAIGLSQAYQSGEISIQNLREKLGRQTGMYGSARHISDAGAQKLVQDVCGPAHQCAKRILWQIDAETPLEPSEASRFNGIPASLPESAAIPLLCQEACNHFVSECRKISKAEHDGKRAAS